MLLIANNPQQLFYLRYTKYLRQLMTFTWIKTCWNNKRAWIYMFKIKTTGLRCLVAFFSPYTMLLYNKADVVYNILLRNSVGQFVTIMGKQKPHLLHVVAYRTNSILFCQQRIV